MHVQPRAGALLVWVGWALVLGPASYLASYVPLLGGLVGCMHDSLGTRGGAGATAWVRWAAWVWACLARAGRLEARWPGCRQLLSVRLGLVAIVLAGAHALTVIALAWLFYRPFLAATLLALAAALLCGGGGALRRSVQSNRRPPAAPAGAAAAAAAAARAPAIPVPVD